MIMIKNWWTQTINDTKYKIQNRLKIVAVVSIKINILAITNNNTDDNHSTNKRNDKNEHQI